MCDFGASAAAGGAAAASSTAATMTAYAALMGAAMTAYGAYQQGQTAQKMANYNAEVTKVKADDALSTGALAEDRQRARVRQVIGAQTAQMGATGAEINGGSNADILDQSAKFGELDALTIRSNAMKQAWGLQTQETADNLQGALAASQGRATAVGSLLSAAPTIYKSGQAAGWWKK